MSWGLANEAAYCIRWLSAFELPGPTLLADLLELNDGLTMAEVSPVSLSGTWYGAANRLCPVITGAAMSDNALQLQSGNVFVLQNITQPLLLVPFAGSAALFLDTPVAIKWQGVSLTTDGRVLSIDGDQETLNVEFADTVACTVEASLADRINPIVRGELDDACKKRLSVFANRTFAPATEESRRLGAG